LGKKPVFPVWLGFFSVWFFLFQAYKTKIEPVGFFKIIIGLISFFSRFGFFSFFLVFSVYSVFSVFFSFLGLIGFLIFLLILIKYDLTWWVHELIIKT
jgi:hypothetical protein